MRQPAVAGHSRGGGIVTGWAAKAAMKAKMDIAAG
jgi:alpha-beta hydrolase superfamily lysophospholipase